MPKKNRVLILYTGGTFGMIPDPKDPRRFKVPELSDRDLKRRIFSQVPELSRIADCEIEVLYHLDSSHLGPVHWIEMSQAITRAAREYSGIVLLHGTDTLPYTASALSLLNMFTSTPIVLTGAQRPLSVLRNDARRNLISAVEFASKGKTWGHRGVFVFFDERLFLGRAVRKKSATLFDAFESPRYPVLAEVGSDWSFTAAMSQVGEKPKRRNLLRALKLQPQFSRGVVSLVLTPAFPSALLRSIASGGAEGVLLTAFPSGTGPTQDPLLVSGLEMLRARGIPVVIATEGSGQAANTKTYAAARVFQELDCVFAESDTPEYGFVKMSYILGQKSGQKKFQKYWNAFRQAGL